MSLFDNVQKFYTVKVDAKTARDGYFQGEVYKALERFKAQDWGDVSETDRECNNEAAKNFDMILGAYETSEGRIWIIAESSTGYEYDRLTVLFPDEY